MIRNPAILDAGKADTPGRVLRWLKGGAILLLAVVAVAVLGARIVLFEPFSIPSRSMYPTLLVGDYLFVSKYSYGYSRYSFPLGLVDFEGRIWESPVERGDVAVFRNPHDVGTDYIKRIVGLPGDRIQIMKGVLHIDGAPVARRRIEDYELWPGRKVPQYLETLPNGRVHRIVEEFGDTYGSDETREYVVPAGHYFAMGDNRDSSADSRFLGPIPAENFIGRAEILYFSWDGDPGPEGSYIRFERIFDVIE